MFTFTPSFHCWRIVVSTFVNTFPDLQIGQPSLGSHLGSLMVFASWSRALRKSSSTPSKLKWVGVCSYLLLKHTKVFWASLLSLETSRKKADSRLHVYLHPKLKKMWVLPLTASSPSAPSKGGSSDFQFRRACSPGGKMPVFPSLGNP